MPTPSPTPRSASPLITIAGETNLDLILYGLPNEMPLDREILGSNFEVTLGGSSSILAHNLCALGASVRFISQVGNDEMGEIALRRLREIGIDEAHIVRRSDVATGVTILLPHQHGRQILTYQGAMVKMTVADLDLDVIRQSRHFHLSSLFLQTGLHAGLPQFFDKIRHAGLTISLDTNDDPDGAWAGILEELLPRIDLLLPNEDEILEIARQPTLELALDALAGTIPLIVVKCGGRGAVVQQGTKRVWVDPVSVQTLDTIGAGDSFNAGFLHAYLSGKDPVYAAAMGNITGALSTLRPGGTEAYRDVEFRERFLTQHHFGKA